jgi:type IV pilus assembly protein PilA
MLKKLGLKLKEQKGFTLIELLAVIVILGIIAAIAIPAISSVISKSDTKAQAQEGVQIINAAKLIVANKEAEFTGGTATIERDAPAVGKVGLMDYLDRVDAPDKATAAEDFEVVVTKDGTTGKYTYDLKLHPINVTAKMPTMSEQDLIEKAK